MATVGMGVLHVQDLVRCSQQLGQDRAPFATDALCLGIVGLSFAFCKVLMHHLVCKHQSCKSQPAAIPLLRSSGCKLTYHLSPQEQAIICDCSDFCSVSAWGGLLFDAEGSVNALPKCQSKQSLNGMRRRAFPMHSSTNTLWTSTALIWMGETSSAGTAGLDVNRQGTILSSGSKISAESG